MAILDRTKKQPNSVDKIKVIQEVKKRLDEDIDIIEGGQYGFDDDTKESEEEIPKKKIKIKPVIT